MTTTVTVAEDSAAPLDAADTLLAPEALVVPAEAPTLQVVEPVTLERAKEHLRVVVADDDAYISALITAARQMAEGRLNRTLVQRRRVAYFASWGNQYARGWGGRWHHLMDTPMTLLKPPVVSVDNVGYVDETGGELMLDPARYYLVPANDDDLPRVELQRDGDPLPVLSVNRRDAVRVYYTAGYAPGEVPAAIIQWMLLAIGTMYASRESVVVGAAVVQMLPADFMQLLLQPYMVYE